MPGPADNRRTVLDDPDIPLPLVSPATARFPRAMGGQCHLLHRKCHAGHGGFVVDGGAHGFFVPGGVGADCSVFSDVPAGAAGGRAGRHHGPPAADRQCAARSGGRRHRPVLARIGGVGRTGDPAAVHLCCRLLHCAAVAGLEHQRGGRGAAPGHAAGDHGNVDRMEQRARTRTVDCRLRLCLARCGLGVCDDRGKRPDHDACGTALAARTACEIAPARGAPLERHRRRTALCAVLADDPGSVAAHRRLQRCGLGIVGTAAGDCCATAASGRGRVRLSHGLPGDGGGGGRAGARQAARVPGAGAAGSGW